MRLFSLTAPIFRSGLAGDGQPAPWKLEDGYMEVAPGSGNIRTRQEFGDCQLHLDFASPAEVKGDGKVVVTAAFF
jgi:hypothetical protein